MRQKFFEQSDTVFLDSSTVIPSSIKVFTAKGIEQDSLWHFDTERSQIIFKKMLNDSFSVSYRILPYNFRKKLIRYDSIRIVPKMRDNNDFFSTGESDLFSEEKLITQGSIIRGLSVGNNQDAVLNSKMNLQIAGKLSENIRVEAAVSDETMPIQPDGNTAQIQDFNKIFLKIYSPDFSIIGGDIDVSSKRTFLRYDKQFKGVQYSLKKQSKQDSLSKDNFNFGLAVSKGKYRRQKISAVEGNQGPYKLLGQNGETYILVLSGSERVFIDGKLLKRGESNDYTIDYNSAEITFMPTIIITKNSRIIVEFEYSERNYSRFTTFSDNEFTIGKSDFYFDYYSQKDAKNQPIDMELTDSMKQILYNAGDDKSMAFYPSFSHTIFDKNKILYERKDTTVEGNIFSIFSYTNNPKADVYTVNFSYVGNNMGNYVISTNNINGRIYTWVSPENGIKQGDYSAERELIAPQKHSVAEFGGNIFIRKNSSLNFSTALSNSDLNLFSPKNDNDNFGKAIKISLTKMLRKTAEDSAFTKLDFDYTYTGKHFSAVEQYKEQEFDRNWNLDTSFFSDEHILGLNIENKRQKSFVNINFKSLFYPQNYFGVKPEISGNRVGDKMKIKYNASYLHSKIFAGKRSDFFRAFMDINYRIRKMIVGSFYDSEMNLWKAAIRKSLLSNSYSYYSGGVFFQNNDSTKNIFRLQYKKRYDYLPKNNSLKMSSFSNDFSFILKTKAQKFNTDFLLNYRLLNVLDTNLSKQKTENNLNSRAILNFSLLKNSIRQNVYLGISSGLEQKMQFLYIAVAPSKGVYMWTDYNKDGIKQIDEFQVAQFSDQANYVRIPIQSQDYFRVFGKKISCSLSFLPAKLFDKRERLQDLLSKINNTFSFNIEQKKDKFDLFNFDYANSSKYNLSIYNLLNISPFSGLLFSYIYNRNKSKVLLVNGIDGFYVSNNKFIYKYRIKSNWSVNGEFVTGEKKSNSNYSLNRNYILRRKKTTIKAIYSYKNSNLTLEYSYQDERNILGDEVLFQNNLGINIQKTIKKKYQLSAALKIINNNFRGTSNTSVSYIILEGLKPGINSTWQMLLKRKLNKVIEISLMYSGRYSLGLKAIHSGSINIVAYL